MISPEDLNLFQFVETPSDTVNIYNKISE